MKIKLSKIFWILASVIFISSCAFDMGKQDPVGPGVKEEERVQLELFTRVDNYSPPVTRTGSADETGVSLTPWILVFKRTVDDNTFVFAEAAQAFESNGQSYVSLVQRTVKCKILILANTKSRSGAAEKFTAKVGNSYTEYDYSVANLSNVLSGKTIEEASTMLLSPALSNPQTSVPYATDVLVDRHLLPMSYVYDVNYINSDTKIGSSTSRLLLERSVAKIVVQNTHPEMTLYGATVINVPMRGQLYRSAGQSLMDNTGRTTSYIGTPDYVTDIASAETMIIGGIPGQSTESNPIYVYETRKEELPFVIIKAQYNGGTYYYKMAFMDSNEQRMDILRNYNYTFTITKVLERGYEDFYDAVNSTTPANENLVFNVSVTDASSHDIVNIGKYYLGVSNSNTIVYSTAAIGSAVSGMTLFSISTNVPSTSPPNSNYILASNGITIVSPAAVGGIHPVALAGASGPQLTPVVVNMAANITEGTVTVVVGNLEKTVTIKRRLLGSGTQVLRFPADAGDQQNYISAYVENPPATSWVNFSYTGVAADIIGPSLGTVDGEFYMHISANGSGVARSSNVYAARSDNSQGRIKMIVMQN